jgi:sterol desaturase/sphingolipid hydroxylase (fatty acid hydroxylase superfamily)
MSVTDEPGPIMAFESASDAEAAPSIALPRRGKSLGDSWWTTGMLAAALLVVCGLVGMVSFGIGMQGPPGEEAPGWIEGFYAFVGAVYHRMLLPILIGVFAGGLILERWLPARPQTHGNLGLNILFGGLVVLFIAATGPVTAMIAESFFAWTGWGPVFNLHFNPDHHVLLALAAMLVSALVIDFFFYWFHRWEHANEFLWQAHLLHHTDTELNVTSTNRTHFFEHFLTPVFMATPLTLLFALPRSDIMIISLIPVAWTHFVHSNVRAGFGRFWWLLSSPQYHRIHHSIRPEHQNKNFAVWFPIWDFLFGTAFAARTDEYPETGVEGIEVSTFSDALALPCVQWYRMAKHAFGGRSAPLSG